MLFISAGFRRRVRRARRSTIGAGALKGLVGWLVAAIFTLVAPAATADDFSEEDLDFFRRSIQPLIRHQCLECHSLDADRIENGLRLDLRSGLIEGGDRGPAVELGRPELSLIMAALRYEDDDLQMPPDGKLPDEEIELIAQWIRRGLPMVEPPSPSASSVRHVESPDIGSR